MFMPKRPSKVNSYISHRTPTVMAKQRAKRQTNLGPNFTGTPCTSLSCSTTTKPKAPSMPPLRVCSQVSQLGTR